MKVLTIGGVASLVLALVTVEVPSLRPPLASPYPRADAIAAAPLATTATSRCQPAPPAVRDVVAASKFGESRREHDSTVVDPEAEESYAESTRAVTEFSRRIASLADAFAADPAKGGRNARCAMQWLDAWAGEEALLGNINATGESVRKWELASLASAYLKIRNAPLDREQSAHVRRWLGRIGEQVRKDYSQRTGLDSRSNNHLNWAAWSVMAAAIAADDKDLFDWSVDRFRYALRQVADDGTLPLELKRRQLAAAYHNYALAPLTMLREACIANNVSLSAEELESLQRLTDRVIQGLEDPTYFAQKTGYPQDMSKISETHLAWLEPYFARSRDQRVTGLLERHRPLTFSRLGGNLTAQFGEIPPRAPAASAPAASPTSSDRN